MSRTITPKYTVQMQGMTVAAWHGRLPNVSQLEKFVMEYVVSTMPGFCNEHIGLAHGISIPSFAQIRRNGGEWILVEWCAPMFMVLPDPANYPNVAKKVN